LRCSGPSFGGYLASALEVGFRRRRGQSNGQLCLSDPSSAPRVVWPESRPLAALRGTASSNPLPSRDETPLRLTQVILQYRFNAQTGRLSPNTPHRVEQGDLIGPRHYIHHPSLDVVYFSNEQGCSVTAYRLDGANGTLSSVQTTTTLPAGHSERTTCSQIHLTPSGRLLYVGNRAVNGSSIAAFAIDPETGHLTAAGHTPTEAVPSAFCLDPAGHFLFAAGTASGRLASYRINEQSGALTPVALEEVGHRPAAGGAGHPYRLMMRERASQMRT
jgi:hypothetical protein